MIRLDLKGHRQESDHDCGRACAQMIIGYERKRLNQDPDAALPGQAAMASSESNAIPHWHTDPHELVLHIRHGLYPVSGAATYAMLQCVPPTGSTQPDLDAASALLSVVRARLMAGYPSVVMTGDSEHWEVVVGMDGDKLFTKDTLYRWVQPFNQPHRNSDPCNPLDNTIRFLDPVSAKSLICNAPPFENSAIGIVQSALPTLGPASEVDPFKIRKEPPDPQPRPADIIEWMSRFWILGMARLASALQILDEPVGLENFDWSGMTLRRATYQRDNESVILAGVCPNQSNRFSMLMVFDARGRLTAVRLTESPDIVKSLGTANPDERLWILREQGIWQPFVKTGVTNSIASMKRLHDGLELAVPNESLGRS